jgi:hypothetical protein
MLCVLRNKHLPWVLKPSGQNMAQPHGHTDFLLGRVLPVPSKGRMKF